MPVTLQPHPQGYSQKLYHIWKNFQSHEKESSQKYKENKEKESGLVRERDMLLSRDSN